MARKRFTLNPVKVQLQDEVTTDFNKLVPAEIVKKEIDSNATEKDETEATAKMGYIINKHARSKLISRTKDSRSVQVSITPQGIQYILLFDKKGKRL